MKDLFEHYENLPPKIQDIIEEAGDMSIQCEVDTMELELIEMGWEFDYEMGTGLPINLRKIKMETIQNETLKTALSHFLDTIRNDYIAGQEGRWDTEDESNWESSIEAVDEFKTKWGIK